MAARRHCLLPLIGMLIMLSGLNCGAADTAAFAQVLPGVKLEFPRDYGSHPEYGVEWWYLTGWLSTERHEQLGFQVTFFRTRIAASQDNPSAFAARQLLIAHCAISDPAHGHLWQDQRIRRAGQGLAQAQSDDTKVWIDDWQLEHTDNAYRTHIAAEDFALQLVLRSTQAVMLNGVDGFSQKGPATSSASYYYSQPQLQVSGTIERAAHADAVTGSAWLDHEWSSQYLDPSVDGWDWIGLNFNDGGALMAFRMRDHQGKTYWAAGTLRDAHGQTHTLSADQLELTARRQWRSPRTGVSYPVSWQVRVGEQTWVLEPLLDDQENDTRLSTGAIYWEGAVRVGAHGQNVGQGYLELTGYEKPLTLR
jgi:predicted secreted hydrolase